ncbi:MAG: UDP-N-acetylmuramate dehydrogenase, partial [Candidatus Portnoybacteria bacterium]|nr:UDP-N-acetylmuramate dehydrogenase [Candidatus Portnoybacteria bacterium]
DVLELISLCKKSVKEKFNLNLEEEIRYLGLTE